MIWAIERLSGVEESVVENLKMFFRDMIHTSCITYRWEEDDFIKEDSEMWDRIKTFYNVDPAVMKSNKEYSQKYTHYPKMKK